MAINSIPSVSTPTTVLAQSLEQAARRSGSEALRDFAAQIAARQTASQAASTGAAAPVVSPAPVQTSATTARNVTAIEPDPSAGLRRPGSVLDIRV